MTKDRDGVLDNPETPIEGYLYLKDKNFEADLIFKADQTTVMRVNIPSGPGSLSMLVDEEFKADVKKACDELMAAVIEETLPYEICESCTAAGAEEFKSLCGQCGTCAKCKRHIKGNVFDKHGWWCFGERYRPYEPPPAKPVQGGLF